jgi:hypothetical protein
MQPGPFGSPTPPATTDQRVRPSLVWFWVAGAIALMGIIAGVVMIVRGITGYESAIEDFDRADLPATLEVEITDTGGYSIYHEYDGAYDEVFATPPNVTVTDPSGNDVPLDDYDTSVTYSADGHEGEGVFTFDADERGTYEVTASGDSGNAIAVGRGLGRGLVGAIVGGLAVGLAGVVVCAVIAIVIGVRRSRSRRALRPARPFTGWGPPPSWGGPAGAPGGQGGGPGGYGPPGGYGSPGGYGPPGGYGNPPTPPPPPPPPPATDASVLPSHPGEPPTSRARGTSFAVAPSVPPTIRTTRPPAGGRRTAAAHAEPGTADPPSLRAPVDWSRGDVPLHWSRDRR